MLDHIRGYHIFNGVYQFFPQTVRLVAVQNSDKLQSQDLTKYNDGNAADYDLSLHIHALLVSFIHRVTLTLFTGFDSFDFLAFPTRFALLTVFIGLVRPK